MTGRSARLVAPALVAALLLTGCTEQGTQAPIDSLGGAVQQWPEPPGEPVSFSGTTVEGEPIDSADLRGDVVVVNFWYAACPPCRTEAPVLADAAERFAADGVRFVGVNTIDGQADAAGFERTFRPGYPSILDQANGASVQLAFAAARGPNATPTTLVLDREGRVTARISGQADGSILRTLVQDAVDTPWDRPPASDTPGP